MSSRPFFHLSFALLLLLASTPADAEESTVDPLAPILTKIDADDLEGAIVDLEILREEGEPSPRALATLGALYQEIGLPQDALDVLAPLAESEDADPAVLYNAGRAALDLGDAERGVAFLERSVAQAPVSPAARHLGLYLGAKGRTADAYRLLRPWALTQAGDVEARLAAAAAALKLGRADEGEALLEGLDDGSPRVRLLRGDLALARRDPADAARWLEPLAQGAPAEMAADVLVLLTTAWLELGRSTEAIQLLSDRAAGRPRLALALAKAQNLSGDPAAARRTLEPFVVPLLERDPQAMPEGPVRSLTASITLEQGRLLLLEGSTEEAVRLLQYSAILDPWRRETWQELARGFAAAGRTEDAEQALSRFQELESANQRAEVPGLKGARRAQDATGQRLAEALEWAERGEGQKALDTVRQEISLAPDDPRPRLLEVRLLLAMGRAEEALAAAGRAVERFPDLPDARHFRAVASLALGDAKAAEADLRAVLDASPGHLPAKNDLALVLARKGETEAARALLEQILEEYPQDSLARERLAALEANALRDDD